MTWSSSSAMRRTRTRGFTLVEALVSLAILAAFGLGSTVVLNLSNDRAAKNRNAEAARAVVNDYINFLLRDNTTMPAVTGNGTDVDGDGTPDGVLCTVIPPNSVNVNGVIPLIVSRTGTPTSVVSGTLYWRVQAVGTAYGLSTDAELAQVNYTLVYTWRNRTFYYKALTFKTYDVPKS